MYKLLFKLGFTLISIGALGHGLIFSYNGIFVTCGNDVVCAHNYPPNIGVSFTSLANSRNPSIIF